MKKIIIPFVWVLLLAIATCGYALEVLPKLKGYVNDYAGMLSKDEVDRISRDLELYESTTSTQIFILTIPSLEGQDIEGFAIKVAENWKAGRKGKDNGVIIILSKADRKIRIEVGRGLEGILTDLTTGRIIDQEMTPGLKAGKTAEVLEVAVAKIKLAVKGEYKGDGKTAKGKGEKKEDESKVEIGLLIFFIVTGLAGFANIFLGGGIGAVLDPTLGFLMFNVTFPMLFIFIIGGFILGLAGRVVLEAGISGGISGGGGGFGGGGGSFGGGGASGSW